MTRTLLFLMIPLTFIVMFDPSFRDALGRGAASLFWPTIGFGAAYPVLTILIAGSLTTIISSVIRHVFTDWVRAARVTRRTAAVSKALMQAVRQGNRTKVQKLQEIQLSTRAESFDVQLAPMKSLAFTLFMFVVVFAWLSQFVNGDVVSNGTLYFAVPWQSQTRLTADYVLFPAWILLYSLLAIPIGQVVTRALKYASFRKRLAAMGSGAAE